METQMTTAQLFMSVINRGFYKRGQFMCFSIDGFYSAGGAGIFDKVSTDFLLSEIEQFHRDIIEVYKLDMSDFRIFNNDEEPAEPLRLALSGLLAEVFWTKLGYKLGSRPNIREENRIAVDARLNEARCEKSIVDITFECCEEIYRNWNMRFDIIDSYMDDIIGKIGE